MAVRHKVIMTSVAIAVISRLKMTETGTGKLKNVIFFVRGGYEIGAFLVDFKY